MEVLVPSEKRYFRLTGKNNAVFQIGNGKLNGCCRQVENLFLANRENGGKLIIWECRVCHRCHYVLKTEHGYIGMTDAKNIFGKMRIDGEEVGALKKVLTGGEINEKEISMLKRLLDAMMKDSRMTNE